MDSLAWRAIGVVGTALAVGVLAAPDDVADVLRLVLLAGVTGSLAGAAARVPRDRDLPWWLLTTAVAAFAVAAAIRLGGERGLVAPGLWGDALVLGGYALLAAAGHALSRTVGGEDTREGLIDGAIVAVSVATVLAVLLFQPTLLESDSTSRIHLFAGPVVFAAIAGVITRFALLMPPACWSARLLVAATIGGLGGNLLRTATVAGGHAFSVGSLPDALLLIGYVAVAVAAWHPSASMLIDPPPGPAAARTQLRLALLGGALLVVPLILALDPPDPGPRIAAAAAALVNGLVLWRIGRLFIDRERVAEQLHAQSRRDPLTGLPNRLQLREDLEAALARAQRTDAGVTVLLCDLDDFKGVNDRLGHLSGDRVLVEIAERLRAGVRAGDAVARLAGDEFVIVTDHGNDAEALAGRLRAAVERPIRVGAHEVTVGVSVGVQRAAASSTAEEVLEGADRAMYGDKQPPPDHARGGLAPEPA